MEQKNNKYLGFSTTSNLKNFRFNNDAMNKFN